MMPPRRHREAEAAVLRLGTVQVTDGDDDVVDAVLGSVRSGAHSIATQSISMSNSMGQEATGTKVRAGKLLVKYRP